MAKMRFLDIKVKLNPGLTAAVARILLALIFLVSGWDKLVDLSKAADAMRSAGVPLACVPLAIVVAAIELLGGAALLVGFRTRLIAVCLAVFLLPVTWFIHLNPALNGFGGIGRSPQMFEVLKNLTTIGGLLLLALTGPGKWAADKK